MDWRGIRGGLEVGLFGSFEPRGLKILDGSIAYLHKLGYMNVRRVDTDVQDKGKLREICMEAATTVPLAAFVFFKGRNEINQSTTIEMTTRFNLMRLRTGSPPTVDNTAVFVETGVRVRGLLEGLGVERPSGVFRLSMNDPWRTPRELRLALAGFLRSAPIL